MKVHRQKSADSDSIGGQISRPIAPGRGLTMSLEWKIHHPDRMVEAVARGSVELRDIERYLDDVVVTDALPYRKLFDMSQAASTLSDEDLMMLGARLSAYTGLGPIGPLAIVAPTPELHQQARLFAVLAPAERPLKIFKTTKAARKWLEVQPSGAASA